jgi:hypothetical protein
MGIAVTQNTLVTPFTTNTRFLMTREESLRNWLSERIDEDVSSFKTSSDFLGMCDILPEDGSTETGIGVVGAGDNFLLIGPGLGGDDGTEWFFLNDSGVVWGVVYDCWVYLGY